MGWFCDELVCGTFQQELVRESEVSENSGQGRSRDDSCTVLMISGVFMCVCVPLYVLKETCACAHMCVDVRVCV